MPVLKLPCKTYSNIFRYSQCSIKISYSDTVLKSVKIMQSQRSRNLGYPQISQQFTIDEPVLLPINQPIFSFLVRYLQFTQLLPYSIPCTEPEISWDRHCWLGIGSTDWMWLKNTNISLPLLWNEVSVQRYTKIVKKYPCELACRGRASIYVISTYASQWLH